MTKLGPITKLLQLYFFLDISSIKFIDIDIRYNFICSLMKKPSNLV